MTNEEKKVVRAYLNNWIKDFEKQAEECKTDLRKANDILEKRSNEMLAKYFFNFYTDGWLKEDRIEYEELKKRELHLNTTVNRDIMYFGITIDKIKNRLLELEDE